MLIGVSSIGWDDAQERAVLSANAGAFNLLEIVPSRIFVSQERPTDIAKRYQDEYGLWTYSAQALFFNSDVQSFEDTAATSEHLLRVVRLAAPMGIKRFVLGSPSLRRGSPSCLMNVLKRLDSVLGDGDAIMCIEPISKRYGGNYFYTVEEIVNQIDFWNLQNVKTMLDTNNAWLQGDSPTKIFRHYLPYIAHVHISDSDNGPLLNGYDHRCINQLLHFHQYKQGVVRELVKAHDHPEDYARFRQIYAA